MNFSEPSTPTTPSNTKVHSIPHTSNQALTVSWQSYLPQKVSVKDLRSLCLVVLAAFLSSYVFNFIVGDTNLQPTYGNTQQASLGMRTPPKSLYLMQSASKFVPDYHMPTFENKVREVSDALNIPPEWLMSVMYSESRFNAGVSNHKGSGAVGLIQWMPATAKDFGITTKALKKLSHVEQLDYVYAYLNRVRKTYGEFESLTELYLAILYPKALSGDVCYTLYAHPQRAYKMNKGLDENKDGRVTVRDIDMRMYRVFGYAYNTTKAPSKQAS